MVVCRIVDVTGLGLRNPKTSRWSHSSADLDVVLSGAVGLQGQKTLRLQSALAVADLVGIGAFCEQVKPQCSKELRNSLSRLNRIPYDVSFCQFYQFCRGRAVFPISM